MLQIQPSALPLWVHGASDSTGMGWQCQEGLQGAQDNGIPNWIPTALSWEHFCHLTIDILGTVTLSLSSCSKGQFLARNQLSFSCPSLLASHTVKKPPGIYLDVSQPLCEAALARNGFRAGLCLWIMHTLLRNHSFLSQLLALPAGSCSINFWGISLGSLASPCLPGAVTV